jgi:uncharacterized protein (DUF1501 family)
MNTGHPSRFALSARRGLSRRALLGNLTLGLGSAALLPGLSLRRALAATGQPNFLVIVNQFGGNDALNTYVPYGLGAYYTARPHIAIPAAQVLPIATGEGLHPALAPIHPLYAAGDLAIVRQTGYPDPNLSHFESGDIWSRGVRDLSNTLDARGWIGRAADLYFPGALDVVGVGVGRLPDFTANVARPLALDGLSSYGPGRSAVPWWEVSMRDAAVKSMLAASAPGETSPGKDLRGSLRNAYDLVDVIGQADAAYTSTVTYPDRWFSTNLRDVAKLVKAGLGGRIFYTGLGGFDTHADQPADHASLLDDTASGLDAFRRDLVAMGAWDRAVILVISEFGRRTEDNASHGTDHGHGLNVLALGGAIHGGVYGPAYTASTLTDFEELPGVVDFRAIYANVLRRHLGVDPTPVFPEAWSGDQEVPLF